jgi:hypothetical protein
MQLAPKDPEIAHVAVGLGAAVVVIAASTIVFVQGREYVVRERPPSYRDNEDLHVEAARSAASSGSSNRISRKRNNKSRAWNGPSGVSVRGRALRAITMQ